MPANIEIRVNAAGMPFVRFSKFDGEAFGSFKDAFPMGCKWYAEKKVWGLMSTTKADANAWLDGLNAAREERKNAKDALEAKRIAKVAYMKAATKARVATSRALWNLVEEYRTLACETGTLIKGFWHFSRWIRDSPEDRRSDISGSDLFAVMPDGRLVVSMGACGNYHDYRVFGADVSPGLIARVELLAATNLAAIASDEAARRSYYDLDKGAP